MNKLSLLKSPLKPTSLTIHHHVSEIYVDLMMRIKESLNGRKRVSFDPKTGVQKHYLDGKLIHMIKVR
jgi:hypothetical protein